MYASAIPAPAFRTTVQRRWLLSVGLLIALLQSSIFAIVDPDLSGWHPNHGHVSIGGFAADHTHPWDHNHQEPNGIGDAVEIGFTGATSEVGSVAGMAMPALVLLAFAVAATYTVTRDRRWRTPRAHVVGVLLPPPRS